MKVFTCIDHAGFYPVGTASVVVAPNEDEARVVLESALKERGLPATKFTLKELHLVMPVARILCDGDY